MISTDHPPPKEDLPPSLPSAASVANNGLRRGAAGGNPQDGCCDNVGARAQALLDRVPPCTSE